MSNERGSFIAEEIRTRNKINQFFYLLKTAQTKEGHEKKTIINQALEIVSQLYIFQDERVGLLIAQEQAAASEASKKEEEPEAQKRDIFAENPFEGKLSEIPLDRLDSLTKEHPKLEGLLTEIPEAEEDKLSKNPIPYEANISGLPEHHLINDTRSAFLEAAQTTDDIEIIDVESASKKFPQVEYKLNDKEIDRTQSLLSYLQKTQNLKELAEIEAEIEISGNEFNCLAHKGPLEGSSYICPKCKSLFCFKCAIDLHEKGERCMLCETPFQM